ERQYLAHRIDPLHRPQRRADMNRLDAERHQSERPGAAGPPFPLLHVMRHEVLGIGKGLNAADLLALQEGLGFVGAKLGKGVLDDVLGEEVRGLIVVDHGREYAVVLDEPYRRIVVDADVPGGLEGLARNMGEISDATFALSLGDQAPVIARLADALITAAP